jgi:putative FmdB family regulatory protein
VPIYEYRCPNCGNVEEVLVTMSAFDCIVICSECGDITTKKISKFVNLFNPTKRGS